MKKNVIYWYQEEQNNTKCCIMENDFYGFHFASFKSLEQLKRFVARFGGKLRVRDKWNTTKKKKTYSLDCGLTFKTGWLFWNKEELPGNAKPIKALSNGSITTCYYTLENNVVTFYRPNSNAVNVYDKMPTNEHIAFQIANGIY